MNYNYLYKIIFIFANIYLIFPESKSLRHRTNSTLDYHSLSINYILFNVSYNP